VPDYLVLLRAISNVPMEPFRKAMAEELGFDHVESHGMSGNILFTALQPLGGLSVWEGGLSG
jgi:uncharacterized protein (DUF1697 family)